LIVDRSELEGVRIEMTAGFGRMEGKLDAYVQSHTSVHALEQQAFGAHLIDAAVRQAKVEDLIGDVEAIPPRVKAIEDWRIEVRTFGLLLRAVFGTSVLGVIVGVVALLKSLGLI
jgi:hypothetical protein